MNPCAKVAVQIASAVFATLASMVYAAEPLISKDQVAALLEYPVAALDVADSTEAANKTAARKGRPLVVSSHTFRASDHSFAPLGIVVASAGTLLTQELLDYYDKALASPVGPQTGFQKISFPDLATGVVGPGVVGPGGYSMVATVTVPFAGKDVRVSVFVPGDGQLARVPAAERHYALLMQSTELTERLVKCVEITAQAVVAAAKAPQQVSPNIPASSPGGDGKTTAPLAAVSNAQGMDSYRMPFAWLVFAALILSVVVALLIYRNRRKTRREKADAQRGFGS